MRILISNDDGVHAPGISVLARALQGLGEITVVAPDSERSAVGHAITIADPIRVRKIERDGWSGFAVGGTPADAVKLAASRLLPEPPELVVSGINLGPNAGIAVIYSGTVSAAAEGTILHIPSMAVSLNTFADPHWETAAGVARALTARLIADPLPAGTLLNVNVPNVPASQLRGYRVARMAPSRFIETFHERTDPRGGMYFWMDGYLKTLGEKDGTDLQAVADGYVALTAIHFDLTDEPGQEHLRRWSF